MGENISDAELNALTYRIIGAAIEVHRQLGPGLLESAYEACLAYELVQRGMQVERQVPLSVQYKTVRIDCAYRLDLVVDEMVIVELKAVEAVAPIHTAQVISYLKLSALPCALLINFHAKVLTDGVQRFRGERLTIEQSS